MSTQVVVIDYQMGNTCSVLKALNRLGVSHQLSANPDVIRDASHLILPGVGHFETGSRNLQVNNLNQLILEHANAKPLLGICLGMQLLFNSSAEAPGAPGLGLIDGHFDRFQVKLKVPHIGWNEIRGDNLPAIFKDIPSHTNFYFVHSYYAILNESLAVSETDYEINFVSAVQKNKIFGTQFHPEKSQSAGLKILKNFIEFN